MTQSRHQEQTDMMQKLELSGREFKIIMINMLKTLMEKVDNM